MDKQQIEKWGYEADNHADVVIAMPGEYHPDWHIVRDEYFAGLIAAYERGQCALAADTQWICDPQISGGEAIRKRDNQQSK